ncbi:hypothetical protein [Rhizomonospora bruguierae]|uniref:hypothetical protein n=1 Tax=Rhizomonospora bruguierae TaxID=1581705 RepID=UPI001BD16901|nr:hypothetical protein [Micromonospora sp. NBRC 107566]
MTRSGYTDQEWGLLVGLPQSVVAAASAVEADGVRRTAAESNAGLETIADGRDSGSPLVEAVATAIVGELGDPDDLLPGGQGVEELPPIRPADPDGLVRDVLDRAREASRLLAEKAEPEEAAAYRHWLVGVAEAVAEAAATGGLLGLGGEQVSPSEQRFVADLSTTLGA